MKRAKKDRPKAGTFEQSRPGASRGQKERAAADPAGICRACAENHYCNYYTKFSAECKPQSGRGRRCPPHVLGHAADLYRGGGAGEPARPPDRLDGEVKPWKSNIGATGA